MISNKIIFICGHRKCSTTTFGNLFDNHKDLVVYPTDHQFSMVIFQVQ